MAKQDWIDVGASAELSQREVQPVTAKRARIALCYRDGRFSAISGVCNHVGGPLGEGKLDGDYVVCPWHYWKFHCRSGEGEPGVTRLSPGDTEHGGGDVHTDHPQAAAHLEQLGLARGMHRQGRALGGPDLCVLFCRLCRSGPEDDSIQNRQPEEAGQADDARIGKELGEVSAYRLGGRRRRRTEIDEKNSLKRGQSNFSAMSWRAPVSGKLL